MKKANKTAAALETHLEVLQETKPYNKHSNALINGRQEYSLLEKKMFYFIINQLNPSMDVQEDLFGDLYFKIPVRFFGNDYSHRTLSDAVDKIHSRKIRIHDATSHFVINPIGMGRIRNGIVELKLQKEAVGYFVDLKKYNYTRLELEVLLSLTSVYSQRLYEKLSQRRKLGSWGPSLDELRMLLALDTKPAYKEYSNIVIKVLEPARKELAEKTDIRFTYTPIKGGRKVVGIEFSISTNTRKSEKKEQTKDLQQQFKNLTPGQQVEFINESLELYDFTPQQKEKIHHTKKFLDKFLEVHLQLPDNVQSDTKYMAKCLRSVGWK